MESLPARARERLGSIPLCRPHGTALVRALIPADLTNHFEALQSRGGIVRFLNVREEVILVARGQIGTPYGKRAHPEEAPEVFSCSTLTQWVFAHVGIQLPRYAIDQSYVGMPMIGTSPPMGTLVFFKNRWPIQDPGRAIGHVGIHVQGKRMIHGSSSAGYIAEEETRNPLVMMADPIPRDSQVLLELPDGIRGLQTALDAVRWLQR